MSPPFPFPPFSMYRVLLFVLYYLSLYQEKNKLTLICSEIIWRTTRNDIYIYIYKMHMYSDIFSHIFISQVTTMGTGRQRSTKYRDMEPVKQLSNSSLKVFFRQSSLKMVKHEVGILILGQNYILCGHSVVHFSV